MIRRIRDYGKQKPTKDSHKIYVICEDKGTEPDYFAFFEGLSSNLQVITIPPTTRYRPSEIDGAVKGNSDRRGQTIFHQLSIWLYYHIYDSKPTDEDVEKTQSFKEFVNIKISGGFNFQIHPVYLEDAIQHSEEYFSKDDAGLLEKYATEMHLLGREILGFTKHELDKLKNKIG